MGRGKERDGRTASGFMKERRKGKEEGGNSK